MIAAAWSVLLRKLPGHVVAIARLDHDRDAERLGAARRVVERRHIGLRAPRARVRPRPCRR